MAGAGIFRYGKWESKVREAGGSDPPVKTKWPANCFKISKSRPNFKWKSAMLNCIEGKMS